MNGDQIAMLEPVLLQQVLGIWFRPDTMMTTSIATLSVF